MARTSTQTTEAPQSITLDDVVKRFAAHAGSRRAPAFGPISLQIAPGASVAIVGRSGVGKSTVLRLMASLLPADGGTIRVGDIDARTARGDKVFGFMPQSPALLPWKSARDNVALLGQLNKQCGRQPLDADEALESVGLGDVAGAMPNTLSGGMRQRVALARTLATRAPVLLLDEPFSALDEVTRRLMHNHLRALRDGRQHTMVFVTHDLREATLLADRVIVLAGHPAAVVEDADTSAITGDDTEALQQTLARLRSHLGEEGAA